MHLFPNLCILYIKKIQEFHMHNCYQNANCNSPYNQSQNASQMYECDCYLAIANVPWQYFTNSYDPERALKVGTLFPELDKPFLGRGVKG